MRGEDEREILELLRAASIPCEVRVGAKHRKILADGRLLVVIPNCAGGRESRRTSLNVICHVKRYIRQRGVPRC